MPEIFQEKYFPIMLNILMCDLNVGSLLYDERSKERHMIPICPVVGHVSRFREEKEGGAFIRLLSDRRG